MYKINPAILWNILNKVFTLIIILSSGNLHPCVLEKENEIIQPIPVPQGVGVLIPGQDKNKILTLFSCGLTVSALASAYHVVKVNPGQCFTATFGRDRVLYQCSFESSKENERCRIEVGNQSITPEKLPAGTGKLVPSVQGDLLVNCGTKITSIEEGLRSIDLRPGQCRAIITGKNIELFQCQ